MPWRLSGNLPKRKGPEIFMSQRSLKKFFYIFSLAIGLSLTWASLSLAAYYTFPAHLDLCGEPVPLSDQAVYERLDREFLINVYDRGQVFLWLKRSSRYFPYIEARLKEKGMPDDLKYLLVAESSLRPQANSNKGAVGFWQFIEKTGRKYNLQKKPWLDERMDLEKSTEAALSYLQFLHNLFGQWTLAMAAYNCGEDRVREEMVQQGENDFYRLALPKETERYIFRILTVKTLLSDPVKYDFDIPAEEWYSPVKSDVVVLELSSPILLRDIAKACGSNFRELKELNPEIQGNTLPAGTHRLKIPFGSKALLEKNRTEWILMEPKS
jgi:membrane-bound lytic murein transglycosylase D